MHMKVYVKNGDVGVKCPLEDVAFTHYCRATFTLTQFPYSAIMGSRLSRIPYNSEIKAKVTETNIGEKDTILTGNNGFTLCMSEATQKKSYH